MITIFHFLRNGTTRRPSLLCASIIQQLNKFHSTNLRLRGGWKFISRRSQYHHENNYHGGDSSGDCWSWSSFTYLVIDQARINNKYGICTRSYTISTAGIELRPGQNGPNNIAKWVRGQCRRRPAERRQRPSQPCVCQLLLSFNGPEKPSSIVRGERNTLENYWRIIEVVTFTISFVKLR